MKRNIKQTKKDFESELNNTIIWGARSITIQLNNNCSPKLFNKELNIVCLDSNHNQASEPRDNTNTKSVTHISYSLLGDRAESSSVIDLYAITTVIPISLKKSNNNDRIDHE